MSAVPTQTVTAAVVGGAMIDTVAIIDSSRIERMVMRNNDSSYLLLEEGRKVEALEISTHCGGGAVNAAIAMARMGLGVSIVAKLGQDERADTILKVLRSEAVSTDRVLREPAVPTGASILVSSHERNAAVFTYRGANSCLVPQDLTSERLQGDLVYVANLSNASAECFPHILRIAKERPGTLVAVNPGMRQISAYGEALISNLGRVDILALNKSEADMLVPQIVARTSRYQPQPAETMKSTAAPLLARGLASGGFELGLIEFLQSLFDLGAGQVLITDGARGAYAASQDALSFCPALGVEVQGTAGAGDAFVSTFAAMKAARASDAEALKAATVNAASVLGYADTTNGLLGGEDIAARSAALASLEILRWSLKRKEAEPRL